MDSPERHRYCGSVAALAACDVFHALDQGQALSRERGLGEASAALVAAADLPAVDAAVRAALGRLMPPDAVTSVVFATDDRQLTMAALAPVEAASGPRSWWVADSGDHLRATLVCPLWPEPLAVARPAGAVVQGYVVTCTT